jgi:hypothetical protein
MYSNEQTLGDVYTCDFPYESLYDSVYDFLVSSKLIFDFFWLKCVNKPLQWVTEKEWSPYSFCAQILHAESDGDSYAVNGPFDGKREMVVAG